MFSDQVRSCGVRLDEVRFPDVDCGSLFLTSSGSPVHVSCPVKF